MTEHTLTAPRHLGPVPEDVLDQMITDARNVAMHDSCDVPGPYFALLMLPALEELRQRRALDHRADAAGRGNILSLVSDGPRQG